MYPFRSDLCTSLDHLVMRIELIEMAPPKNKKTTLNAYSNEFILKLPSTLSYNGSWNSLYLELHYPLATTDTIRTVVSY